MDLGRPPLARFPSGDLRLADDVISNADLAHAISKVPLQQLTCKQIYAVSVLLPSNTSIIFFFKISEG